MRLPSSSSGVSSWMLKSQLRGIEVSRGVAAGTVGLEAPEETVPQSAASIENGSPLPLTLDPNEGGSTLVNGEDETRRRDKIPARLLLGDRPATVGAEDGGFLLVESDRRFEVAIGRLAMRAESWFCFKTNLEDWTVLMANPLTFFDFLDGDEYSSGSMFSESKSAKLSGVRGLLVRTDDGTGKAGNVSVQLFSRKAYWIRARKGIVSKKKVARISYHFDGS